jgi:hypothetical protein
MQDNFGISLFRISGICFNKSNDTNKSNVNKSNDTNKSDDTKPC